MALEELDSSRDGVIDRKEFDTFVNMAFSHADHEFVVKGKDGKKVICGNKMEKVRVAKRMEEKKEQSTERERKGRKIRIVPARQKVNSFWREIFKSKGSPGNGKATQCTATNERTRQRV